MPKVNPVQRAQELGADAELCELLQRLPTDRFNSPSGVSEAIGRAQA